MYKYWPLLRSYNAKLSFALQFHFFFQIRLLVHCFATCTSTHQVASRLCSSCGRSCFSLQTLICLRRRTEAADGVQRRRFRPRCRLRSRARPFYFKFHQRHSFTNTSRHAWKVKAAILALKFELKNAFRSLFDLLHSDDCDTLKSQLLTAEHGPRERLIGN